MQRLYDLTGYKQEQTVEKAETRENVMPEEKLESNEKSTPSIHDVVKKGDPSLVEKICNYLSNGTTLV